jgi:hypothetical protein
MDQFMWWVRNWALSLKFLIQLIKKIIIIK